MYRLFTHCFECSFPLPELAACGCGKPVFEVRTRDLEGFDPSGFELAFEWRDEHDRQVCRCERRDGEYLFVFPHHAAFHIAKGSIITCMQDADGTEVMMRHLLLNQVIPRYLASRGHFLLHASALTLQSGRSVAIIGRSGHGKSTLAAAFHGRGASIISDDCIQISLANGQIQAHGGLHGVRLLPDMKQALFRQDSPFARYSPWSEKQQLLLHDETNGPSDQHCQLDALYLLNDPHIEPAEHVELRELPATQAVVALMHCAFNLDPGDAAAREANLAHASDVINTGLPVLELSFPRQLERLPELLTVIEQQMES
ncbi:MAG: hypothetical protein HKO64_03870 [Xanthomonadales bacterium]|nr:hypothetical protein [Xanthomonadales bacterium]